MQFNSEANNVDLVSDIDYWAGSDANSYPIKDKTRNANFALDRVVSLIFKSDGKWKWDDNNNASQPIVATTNLVSGTRTYAIAVTDLKVLRVRIKDNLGNWVTLDPCTREELSDEDLNEADGVPRKYDKNGAFFNLYPAPNYASTSGLEVQSQRAGSYFAYTDTTKVPGFASIFHRLISLYAAMDFCDSQTMQARINRIQAKITELEDKLVDFYSSRDFDEDQKVEMDTRKEDYGQDALSSGVFRSSGKPNRFF